MLKDALRDMLVAHEGIRQFPYTDTTGHLTIGVGRNLSQRGISKAEAFSLLDDDIQYFSDKLTQLLPVFSKLNDPRKMVLVDMCFNLGVNGFLEFKGMIAALEKEDWASASYHIISSKAHSQAPNRYNQLADIMKSGVLTISVTDGVGHA